MEYAEVRHHSQLSRAQAKVTDAILNQVTSFSGPNRQKFVLMHRGNPVAAIEFSKNGHIYRMAIKQDWAPDEAKTLRAILGRQSPMAELLQHASNALNKNNFTASFSPAGNRAMRSLANAGLIEFNENSDFFESLPNTICLTGLKKIPPIASSEWQAVIKNAQKNKGETRR